MTRDASSDWPGERGRSRVVIDAVLPTIDHGRFAVKCTAGEPFEVRAHCLIDGHERLRVQLFWQRSAHSSEQVVEMEPLGNDEWRARFTPPNPGRYSYRVRAWIDHFGTWLHALQRRDDAKDVCLALLEGAEKLERIQRRVSGADRQLLAEYAQSWRRACGDASLAVADFKALASNAQISDCWYRHDAPPQWAPWSDTYPLVADIELASFSAWYEMFPRSCAAREGEHGTWQDAAQRLSYVSDLGFDIVYLPPIHPIGMTGRKGRNNELRARPTDVGSPWAIGSAEGGHRQVHGQLGTLDEFRHFVKRADALNLRVALDVAFQCSPDHPYVASHPEWFRRRPDGSIRYAENPPKKYEDIYPFDFESADPRPLWEELLGVFEFWIDQGISIFRVDNPHTKPFAFWEWCIGQIKNRHPEVLLLSEAFTRPKIMHRLAKLGFSQSYTYFTWRQTARELTDYFEELYRGPGRDYFRPCVWPNTPDILHEQFHGAGPAMFKLRVLLAATLAGNYGIYGPAYELCINTPLKAGSEEYLDSEKYQLRHWGALDVDRGDSIARFVSKLNDIRRRYPAFRHARQICFHPTDNESLLAYSKRSLDGKSTVLVVVNLDVRYEQSGWIDCELSSLDLRAEVPFDVHDVLNDQRFTWRGSRNFIALNPAQTVAHVFVVQQA